MPAIFQFISPALVVALCIVTLLVGAGYWVLKRWAIKHIRMTVTNHADSSTLMEDAQLFLQGLMLSDELTDEQSAHLHDVILPLLQAWEAENELPTPDLWDEAVSRVH